MATKQSMGRNLFLHNMLLLSLGLQITVTFSTPTPAYNSYDSLMRDYFSDFIMSVVVSADNFCFHRK